MSYVSYNGLKSPNEILEKISEYIKSKGYTIVEDIKDDLNIYNSAKATTDGKKFVFKDKTDTYFICLRSANGYKIFGSSNDSYMETLDVTSYKDDSKYGIGITVGEGYSKTQRWYNQYKVPVSKVNSSVLGSFMQASAESSGITYTLYCNNVDTPNDTLVFTILKENDNEYVVSHMVVGYISKYDTWTGGIYFSATSPSYSSSTYPVLSSGSESNTYLRINIDEAPSDKRGNIYWASSGTDNITGKPLSLPIRVNGGGNGRIPNYWYMQSHSQFDWGRNVNTLNCITINMPIYMAVRVDPDVLDNYASVGYINGIYFVSMLNMQTSGTYEMSYPKSGDLCQVFPMNKRRGIYGFDGISIKQII